MVRRIAANNVVYLDESGIDNNEQYDYAWTKKGRRAHANKSTVPTTRLSIIACHNRRRIIAPFVFEGNCNREVFETYLEQVLVPELKPKQIVVLDNASFHKGGNIVTKIKSAGCELVYLPPYSPDLNPIEHDWFWIKSRMRKYLMNNNWDIHAAADKVFNSFPT